MALTWRVQPQKRPLPRERRGTDLATRSGAEATKIVTHECGARESGAVRSRARWLLGRPDDAGTDILVRRFLHNEVFAHGYGGAKYECERSSL